MSLLLEISNQLKQKAPSLRLEPTGRPVEQPSPEVCSQPA